MALSKRFSDLTVPSMKQRANVYSRECFDAFFIYRTSGKDRELAHDLVQELEKRGFKCGHHEKDFIAGETITDNLERNFQKSLKIVVILSNEFLESRYCKTDLQFAFQRHVEKGDQLCGIIPLLFGIHEDKIPNILKIFTYLDVSGRKREWLQRFIKSVAHNEVNRTMCLWGAFEESLKRINWGAKIHFLRNMNLEGISQYTQQMGRCVVAESILKSCGIYIDSQVHIDLSSLKIKEVIPIYNEYCEAKNIKSKLKLPSLRQDMSSIGNNISNDECKNFGTADCSITFYGFDEDKTKPIKFVFSFNELTASGVTFSYGSESYFECLKQTTTDIVHGSKDESNEIQLRSKRSKQLRKNCSRYIPYFPINKNNYRRIRLPFHSLGICARVTVSGRLCNGDQSQHYTVVRESTTNTKFLF